MLRRAGVPPAVLQCLPGRGESVGAALVADARVRSVVFTGSTEVARRINQSITAGPGGLYPLYHLLVERVLSIDTTAAGGNASLMTLSA